MIRCKAERVYTGNPNEIDCKPGLYALRDMAFEDNVLIRFYKKFTDRDELSNFYRANRHNITNRPETEWINEIISQIKETQEILKHYAEEGKLCGERGCFRNLLSGKTYNSAPPLSVAQKYAYQSNLGLSNRIELVHNYSYVRLYGAQFGNDLVVVTGACLKLTQTTQEDEHVQAIVDQASEWADIFSQKLNGRKYFQGKKTKSFEISP